MCLTCILPYDYSLVNPLVDSVFGLYCVESSALCFSSGVVSSKAPYPYRPIEFSEIEGDFFIPLDFLVCYEEDP